MVQAHDDDDSVENIYDNFNESIEMHEAISAV